MQSANLVSIVVTPWKKYSDYFDNGCNGIWLLSPIIKYTLLYFSLIIPYAFFAGNIPTDIKETIELLYVVFLIAIALVWFVYLPVLCLLLQFYHSTLVYGYKGDGCVYCKTKSVNCCDNNNLLLSFFNKV